MLYMPGVARFLLTVLELWLWWVSNVDRCNMDILMRTVYNMSCFNSSSSPLLVIQTSSNILPFLRGCIDSECSKKSPLRKSTEDKDFQKSSNKWLRLNHLYHPYHFVQISFSGPLPHNPKNWKPPKKKSHEVWKPWTLNNTDPRIFHLRLLSVLFSGELINRYCSLCSEPLMMEAVVSTPCEGLRKWRCYLYVTSWGIHSKYGDLLVDPIEKLTICHSKSLGSSLTRRIHGTGIFTYIYYKNQPFM